MQGTSPIESFQLFDQRNEVGARKLFAQSNLLERPRKSPKRRRSKPPGSCCRAHVGGRRRHDRRHMHGNLRGPCKPQPALAASLSPTENAQQERFSRVSTSRLQNDSFLGRASSGGVRSFPLCVRPFAQARIGAVNAALLMAHSAPWNWHDICEKNAVRHRGWTLRAHGRRRTA